MTPSLIRGALPLILFATAAGAQEFELDLSEEKPAVSSEFRPTLGVLSVKAADGEDVSASRARQLEAELLKQLGQGDLFLSVVEPSGARSQLGADFAKAEACTDYSCMEANAKKLKVNRLVRLTVQKHGVGSLVTMYGYDPGFNEVLVVSQESGEKAEKTFLGVAGKTQSRLWRGQILERPIDVVLTEKSLFVKAGSSIDEREPLHLGQALSSRFEGAFTPGHFSVFLDLGQLRRELLQPRMMPDIDPRRAITAQAVAVTLLDRLSQLDSALLDISPSPDGAVVQAVLKLRPRP